MLVSQPLATLPSQLAKPGLQAKPHTPFVQPGVALGRAGQAVPQPPQLVGSVCVLTQTPEQLVWPVGQTQFPPTQARPAGQMLPHVPQLLALVCVLTQAPPQLV